MTEPSTKGVTMRAGKPAELARQQVEARDSRVLEAALALANSINGLERMTRESVAMLAGVATGSVNTAFGTMADLRIAVVEEAIKREVLAVVAQGIAGAYPAALAAPRDLQMRALASLTA